jgi:hypothetical protein
MYEKIVEEKSALKKKGEIHIQIRKNILIDILKTDTRKQNRGRKEEVGEFKIVNQYVLQSNSPNK